MSLQALPTVSPCALIAEHVRHGALTIDRLALSPLDERRIAFRLTLEKGGICRPAVLVRVTVNRANATIGHCPSLGYRDGDSLHLAGLRADDSWFGSAAHLLHAFFASTGIELEFDTFVIEGLASRPAENFCRTIGMHPVRINDRWISMKELLRVTQVHARSRGWKFSRL